MINGFKTQTQELSEYERQRGPPSSCGRFKAQGRGR